MDTGKQYLAMCDCPEIQDEWKPTPLDFYIEEADGCVGFIGFDIVYSLVDVQDWVKGKVWIPKQDQLQGMLSHTVNGIGFFFPCVTLLGRFIDYTGNLPQHETAIGGMESFEQLWLGCLMYYLYSKRWSGGEDGVWYYEDRWTKECKNEMTE